MVARFAFCAEAYMLVHSIPSPKQVLTKWVAGFNARDAEAVADLYHDDAVNLQVAIGSPLRGKREILENTAAFFRAFPDNYTNIENLFEDADWAILEWNGGGTFLGRLGEFPPTGKNSHYRAADFFMWSMER